MTKNEWNNLRVGDPVTIKTTQFDRQTMKPKIVVLTATVDIFNFGCSQALIKFSDGQTLWKGRLGIELKK